MSDDNLSPRPSSLDLPKAFKDSRQTSSPQKDESSQKERLFDAEDESIGSEDDLEFLDFEDEESEEDYLEEDEFLDEEAILQREVYLFQATCMEESAYLKEKKLPKHLGDESKIDSTSGLLDVNARSPVRSSSQGTQLTLSSSGSTHDLKFSTSSYYGLPGISATLRNQSSQTEWAYKTKSVIKLILQEKGLPSVDRPQRALDTSLLSSISVSPSIPNRIT